MSEMVERVARALMKVRMPYITNTEALPLPSQALEDARAAIAAMREPTDEMAEKAFDGPIFASAHKEEIIAGWQAMIDQALK